MSNETSGMRRFVWHDLMTTDLDRAMEFYSTLFPEWQVMDIDVPTGPGPYRMIKANGKDCGGMIALEQGAPVPSHWGGYVAVKDCDATVAKMESLGGACLYPAVDIAGVGRFAAVSDPQGAILRPIQLIEPPTLPVTPGVGQFCWDELHTNDIDSARDFYRDAFDWDLDEMDMGEMGVYTLFQVDGQGFAGGMNMPPDAEAPPNWLAYVAADDVDARAKTAEELGAATFVAPRDIPGVGRFSVHADPTGAVFALFQAAIG